MAKSPEELVYATPTPPYLPFPRFLGFLNNIKKYYSPGSLFIPEEVFEHCSEETERLLLRALDFFHLLQADRLMTTAMDVYLRDSTTSQQMAMQQWIVTSYPSDLFRAIAEKDGEAIAAAFPSNLSASVRNRCLAFLRGFARAVSLDLSAVWERQYPLGRALAQSVDEAARRTPAPRSFWTETVLTLDWGRFCILKHDGPLSTEDVGRIKEGLDMLVNNNRDE